VNEILCIWLNRAKAGYIYVLLIFANIPGGDFNLIALQKKSIPLFPD